MRKLLILVIPAALAAGLCSLPAAAQTEPGPTFEISPNPPVLEGTVGGPIQIPPDDIETFWAHISWAGHETEALHINDVSWEPRIETAGKASTEVVEWYAQPCQWVTVCTWFKWNKVHTTGTPCSYIYFTADIKLDHGAGTAVIGPINSNTIVKHIVPEPSGMLALGCGAVGLMGLAMRRKR